MNSRATLESIVRLELDKLHKIAKNDVALLTGSQLESLEALAKVLKTLDADEAPEESPPLTPEQAAGLITLLPPAPGPPK